MADSNGDVCCGELSAILIVAIIISFKVLHAADCPDNLFQYEGSCYADCPQNTYLMVQNNTCTKTCPPSTKFIYYRTCYSFCPFGYSDSLYCKLPLRKTKTDIFCPENVCSSHSSHPFCYKLRCYRACPKHTLTEGLQCVFKCSVNAPYEFNGICVPFCPTKHNIVENDRCVSSCAEHHLRYRNKCVEKCPRSTYLYNGTCREHCPSEAPFLFSVNDVRSCMETCPSFMATTSFTCEKCPHGTPLYNRRCVDQCPESSRHVMIEDTLVGKVTLCVAYCPLDRFEENYSCVTRCKDDMVVFNRSCFENCPLNHPFKDTLKGTPYICVSECPNSTYVLNDSCVSHCPEEKIDGQSCVTDCPSERSFEDQGVMPHLCLSQCPENRVQMNASCLWFCPKNYYLHEKICVENCPFESQYVTEERPFVCRDACPNKTFSFNDSFVCSKRCPPTVTFEENPLCYNQCPKERPVHNRRWNGHPYYAQMYECLVMCPRRKFQNGNVCVDKCPEGAKTLHRKCFVGECPPSHPIIDPYGKCKSTCHLYFNGTCVYECPTEVKFTFNRTCVEQCPFTHIHVHKHIIKYAWQHICVRKCPDETFFRNRTCYDQCPARFSLILNNECVANCTVEQRYQYKQVINGKPLSFCATDCSEFSKNSRLARLPFVNDTTCTAMCDSGYSVHGECMAMCPDHAPYFLPSKGLTTCFPACPKDTLLNISGSTCTHKGNCTQQQLFILDDLTCVQTCPDNSYRLLDEITVNGRTYRPYCYTMRSWMMPSFIGLLIIIPMLVICCCFQFNDKFISKVRCIHYKGEYSPLQEENESLQGSISHTSDEDVTVTEESPRQHHCAEQCVDGIANETLSSSQGRSYRKQNYFDKSQEHKQIKMRADESFSTDFSSSIQLDYLGWDEDTQLDVDTINEMHASTVNIGDIHQICTENKNWRYTPKNTHS